MQTVLIGKRGTVVIPAKMRKRYRLDEGSPLLVEEHEEGILMRPAKVSPVDVEIYSPRRLAEFFLNNAMDKEDGGYAPRYFFSRCTNKSIASFARL